MMQPEFRIGHDGRNALMTGPQCPTFLDISRGMPGRRRWVGNTLVFEATRANVEYLRRAAVTLVWDDSIQSTLHGLKTLEQAEADTRAMKHQPPEASNWVFKTKPYQHQRTAFSLCKDREFFALFMEMGTGKTKVIIDVAGYKYCNGQIDQVIVLAPNGVHQQWVEQQVPIHMPDDIPHSAAAYAAYMRKAEKAVWDKATAYDAGLRILTFNIETLSAPRGVKLLENLMAGRRTMLVIDESVRIKDISAARTKNALALAKHATCRFIMSGAPVTQGIEDLFTQLKFLNTDILGYSSFYTFRDHFCTMGGFEGKSIVGYRNVDELVSRLELHSFRVTKNECLDLPAKIYVTREVELTDEQKVMYQSMQDQAFAAIKSGAIVDATNAMVKVLRLQQILSGFLNETDPSNPGVTTQHEFKSNRPKVGVDVVEEAQGKVIVWCRFHYDIVALTAEFKRRGIKWVEYSGRVDDEGRSAAINAFMTDPTVKVFIGTARAGGTGLNLTVANTMVYYSNDFSADTRWQSEDRIHRIGLKGTATYIDIVSRCTIDIRITQALRRKKGIANMALNELAELLAPEAP
jgi:hypothetical protein